MPHRRSLKHGCHPFASLRADPSLSLRMTASHLSSLRFSQVRSFAIAQDGSLAFVILLVGRTFLRQERHIAQDDSLAFVILSGAKDLRSAYRARPFAEFTLSEAHVLRVTRCDCSYQIR